MIAITGHSRGLGKYLFNYFTELGYLVQGYSKSNGYDLTSKEIRQKIIFEIDNCKIFINSAYDYNTHNNFQTHVLKEICQEWVAKPKYIFNIGSISSSIISPVEGSVWGDSAYISNKLEQDYYCKRFCSIVREARLTNLRLGLIARIPARANGSNDIPLLYIANTINNIINDNTCTVTEITIKPISKK